MLEVEGEDWARLLRVLCHPVTALFSPYSPSQTRVCRVSLLTMYILPSFLPWSALGREWTHCYPSSVGRGVLLLYGLSCFLDPG